MNDLEEAVRHALRVDADRAPSAPNTWDPLRPFTDTSASSTRLLWLAIGIAATIAAAAITITITRDADDDTQNKAVATADHDPTPTTAATPPPSTSPPAQPFAPAGDEFPLDDLGESSEPASLPLAPQTLGSLTRVIGIPDSAPLAIYRTLKYMGERTASEFVCISQAGGSGCSYDTPQSPPSVSITSTIANNAGPSDLFVWQNVPDTAAYVAAIYIDGPPRWQRPVARVAAFPTKLLRTDLHPAGSVNYAIAYDADGNELSRAAFGTQAPGESRPPTFPPPLKADISRNDFDLLVLYTDNSMQTCLDQASAPQTDQADIVIWNRCVTQVKDLVQQAVDGLNPRFYDPTNETPQNPNPPFAVSNPPATS